jgi:hypothetical protein
MYFNLILKDNTTEKKKHFFDLSMLRIRLPAVSFGTPCTKAAPRISKSLVSCKRVSCRLGSSELLDLMEDS